MSKHAATLLPFPGEDAADELSAALGITKRELAETTGLPAGNLNRKARAAASHTQNRLRETMEILYRVTPWAGGIKQAAPIHGLAANLLFVLVLIHIAGALYQRFVLKTDVMSRMAIPEK